MRVRAAQQPVQRLCPLTNRRRRCGIAAISSTSVNLRLVQQVGLAQTVELLQQELRKRDDALSSQQDGDSATAAALLKQLNDVQEEKVRTSLCGGGVAMIITCSNQFAQHFAISKTAILLPLLLTRSS